jgi:hypothetical protein
MFTYNISIEMHLHWTFHLLVTVCCDSGLPLVLDNPSHCGNDDFKVHVSKILHYVCMNE